MGGRKRGLTAVVAALATLAVALGLATPALAATITVNQPEQNHIYNAYQILKATVTEDANHTNVRLSNVQWGDNVNGDALLSLLHTSQTNVYAATDSSGVKSDTTVATVFGKAQSAEDFAAVFDWAADNSALAQVVAEIIEAHSGTVLKGKPLTSTPVAATETVDAHYTIEVNNPGYYYIKDTGSAAGTPSVFIQIFHDDKDIAPKNATPTLEKKVQENAKYQINGGYGVGYNDSADYSIGDSVPFKLIGAIPDMSAYNNGYQYTITDTLSTSLTAPESTAVKVFLSTTKDASVDASTTTAPNGTVDVTSQFSVSVNGQTITVQPNITGSTSGAGANDLKQVVTTGTTTLATDTTYKYVIVVYSATLNSNAALGQQTISDNKLGETGATARDRGNVNKAHLDYSNNPSFPSNTHDSTPDDYVIVFTYGTTFTKVDASNPTTKIDNVVFRLYKYAADGSTKQYAIVDEATHKLGVLNTTNNVMEYWTDDSSHSNVTLTTENDGLIRVYGLDAGTYYLEEVSTKPNSSYNRPSQPWIIAITAETGNTRDSGSHAQDGQGNETDLSSLTADVTNASYGSVTFRGNTNSLVSGDPTGKPATGLIEATITNTQGFELPQTGGAGTIAITVAGIVLVAGAVITLTIRKRANDER